MTRRLTLLLTLFALILLVLPATAQAQASPEPAPSAAPSSTEAAAGTQAPPTRGPAEPSLPPLPTAVPLADGPAAQAVLFFSPTCGHCHYVITEVLPGLFEDTGGEPSVTFDQSVLPAEPSFYLMSNGRLQLLLVDVTQPEGSTMFGLDSKRLGTGGGVPRLDIKDTFLMGSADIPDQLPGLIDEGLAGTGIGWPPVPELGVAIAPFLADGSVSLVDPAGADDEDGQAVVIPIVGDDEGPLDRLADDPVGNGVAVVVLVALLISLIAAPVLAARGSLPAFPTWLVPLLVMVGIGVAAYLASVESSGGGAVCGPVGDCNAVQQSEYAQLFGIPIGVLGVIGYLLIGGLWLISRFASGAPSDVADVLIALGAYAGTLFSVYLTFLEPFVIGATCMWCITSAIVMVALLWISAGRAWSAWQRLRGDSSSNSAAGAPASP